MTESLMSLRPVKAPPRKIPSRVLRDWKKALVAGNPHGFNSIPVVFTKAAILAISRRTGRLVTNPAGEETIQGGDILITLGTREQLAAVEEICERCEPDE